MTEKHTAPDNVRAELIAKAKAYCVQDENGFYEIEADSGDFGITIEIDRYYGVTGVKMWQYYEGTETDIGLTDSDFADIISSLDSQISDEDRINDEDLRDPDADDGEQIGGER